MVWNAIAPQAAHQQCVENLVQTAKHLGKTHVDEARRSVSAKIHCIFYHNFSTWSLDILWREDETKKKQTKQRRVEGKKRLEMFSEWTDQTMGDIDKARQSLEERGELKALVAEMYQDHKSSSLDNI